MKFVCLSDLHSFFPKPSELPEGDAIIFCGDATRLGSPQEVVLFFQWFSNLGYQHKICIAGNHDFLFQDYSLVQTFIPKNVTYLFDSSVEIDGKIIYGTPWQPYFCNWAFNKMEFELENLYKRIPDETEILITHCPPRKILDENMWGERCGSNSLYERILQLKNLKLHVFGHIHECGGLLIEQDNIKFVNASYNKDTIVVVDL